VIGAELISPFMDWSDRDVAVLFGDGAAAVVLEASDQEEGVLAEKLGCYGDARETLRVQGMAGAMPTAACSTASRAGSSRVRRSSSAPCRA